MRYLLLVSLLFVVVASLPNPQAPLVDLGYATYQGFFNETNGISTFLGVRYAASPAGAARWLPPSPPIPVAGIQAATQFPPQCFQASTGAALTTPFNNTPPTGVSARATVSDEDCLFLDVYVPGAVDPSRKLPVVVWIHGGGYVAGSATTPGEDLVRDSNNQIIAVLIQYRLGAFGFLPGAAVKAGAVLNAGLLDQQFALQWVQHHITTFGGNPDEVTIWGESAGAGSVLQQLIANSGRTLPPLFRRAMTSSTFLPSQYNFDDVIPEKVYQATLNQTGCLDAADGLACLRAVDVNILQAANTNISLNEFSGEFQWVPVVDGTFIKTSPIASITKRQLNGEALLSITNTFEGQNFVSTKVTTGTLADYVHNAFPNLDASEIDLVVATYQSAGLTDIHSQAVAVQGEAIFICPTYYLLDAFGLRAHKGEFAIPPGVHGNDLPYYFNDTTRPSPLFNNTAFYNSFSGAFMDFIISGNVNRHIDDTNITPQWPAWDGKQTQMLFNVTDDFTTPVIHTFITDPALLARCNVWKSLAGSTKQ